MATFKRFLLDRLPTRQQILSVFSVIVFVVFTWALYRLFFQAPSWLYYLTVGNVLTLVAYVLAFALFESAIVLLFLLVLNLLLPARAFRDQFTAQGTVVVLVAAAAAWFIQNRVDRIARLDLWMLIAGPLAAIAGLILLTVLLAWPFRRFKALRGLIDPLAERMTVFTYIYVPLSLASLVLVLLRNLF